VWSRYFLAPASGPERKSVLSVTLLVGPLSGTLEGYAKSYLAGHTLVSSREDSRFGAKSRSYEFVSADGVTKYSLLLVPEAERIFGLYAQGQAAAFDRARKLLDAMAASLTLERAAAYPEVRDAAFGFSLRIPPSWRETRHFAGGGTLLLQFASPPLAVDKDRQTVHASLTLAVEPLSRSEADLEAYYDATRLKLGDAFKIVSHEAWQGGYVDVMKTETTVSAARVKRFYAFAAGRGYTLTFEAREDVYPRVAGWADLIASTFHAGLAQ
jgi:hypothetical protein